MSEKEHKKRILFTTPYNIKVPPAHKQATYTKIETVSKNTRIVKPDYQKWIRNIKPLSKVLDEHLKLQTRNKQAERTCGQQEIIDQSFTTKDLAPNNYENTDEFSHKEIRYRNNIVDSCKNKAKYSSPAKRSSQSLVKKKVNLQVLCTILKMKNELQMIRERKEKIYKKSEQRVFTSFEEE